MNATEEKLSFHMREFFYPSNLLTVARLLMLPAALRSMRRPEERWRALGTLGIAMLTDALDGPIARHRHEISSLGKVLDPIADKLMVDATAVTLSQSRGFPWSGDRGHAVARSGDSARRHAQCIAAMRGLSWHTRPARPPRWR